MPGQGVYVGLGDPPEFGPRGEHNPPLATEPVIQSRNYTWVFGSELDVLYLLLKTNTGSALLRKRDAIDAETWILQHPAPRPYWSPGPKGHLLSPGLRRITYSRWWVREDPPMVLAPGTTYKDIVKTTIGATEERVREISLEMGLSGSGGLGALSLKLGEKVQARLSLTRQEEQTHEIVLDTIGWASPRKYALWRVVSQLKVESLDVMLNLQPWSTRSSLEWYESRAIHTTAFPAGRDVS